MEDYKKLVTELIEDYVAERLQWAHDTNDTDTTREDILKALQDDTENVFGNIDGSRTCNTWEAQQFIDKSGAIWDEDILSLFEDLGDDYFTETLKRGAETLDVVICELVAPQVISEMLGAL